MNAFTGLRVPVSPGLTKWNVVNATLANSEFVEGVGNKFGPVIERSVLFKTESRVCSSSMEIAS